MISPLPSSRRAPVRRALLLAVVLAVAAPSAVVAAPSSGPPPAASAEPAVPAPGAAVAAEASSTSALERRAAEDHRQRGGVVRRLFRHLLALVHRLFGDRAPEAPEPEPAPEPTTYLGKAERFRETDPDGRPWFCNGVGQGTPLGGHGNGSHVHPHYEGMEKGPLSWDDCLELARQFDAVLATTAGLETRAAAEAAGYNEIAQHIPGLGSHHSKNFFRPGTELDLADPTILAYGGHGPDAPLVGVSYVQWGGDRPPEAFAGDNDWWHLHKKICHSLTDGVLAGAEEVSDEECAALGGIQRNLGAGIWLLHVWLVPGYELKLDVFASGQPCLGEEAPLPYDDPCWDDAFRDPSEGFPPRAGGGDGHSDGGGDEGGDPMEGEEPAEGEDPGHGNGGGDHGH